MGRASLFLAVPPNLAVDKLLRFLRLLRMLRFYCAFEICVIMANQKPEKWEPWATWSSSGFHIMWNKENLHKLYFRYKKTLSIHLRDESTRDTTQIAKRPSLVCYNGQNPKDSSSLSPKWKDNVTMTTHTNRCLSEKVSISLLHHRLLLMVWIIDW